MPLNSSFFKLYKAPLLLVVASFLFYGSFAYYLERSDFTKLIMLYAALFFLFYKLVTIFKHHIGFLTWMAFGFRCVFILAIPNLSQDFYRFIWDGRLIVEGINPYIHTVDSFIQKSEFPVLQAQELYRGMGELNGSHFSNYPPINQLCFAFAALFAGKSVLGSVIILRLIIICADFGTLYFGKKLLEKLQLPLHNIFWYILNPFIIIELTGNLHFEGVMIFFLVWSLYLLHKGKWLFAAFILGLSISVKLIPLVFLPLFYQWFAKRNMISNINKKLDFNSEFALSLPPHNDDRKWISNFNKLTKLLYFYLVIGMTTLLFFVPFYFSGLIDNYSKTIGLWFHQFEFNASLYYIAREIGYLFRGYNEISTIGKVTPVIVVLFVLMLTFLRKNKTMVQLITSMLLVLSFYYFTATTVHPWYIATLLALSIFTKYKFPLVWSFVIVLSYLAYSNPNNTENLWIIAVEYLIVYSVLFYEIFIKKATIKAA
ncbi:mannosyltransferase [Confluentibacter citreus]|uniref:mannosyltransferase n=1 Tax=Confluentibacter citreus TaxID=2007307 RepID=UPI000C28925A|nr:mannosyltransferase [Confluentibacter citreus]